MSQETSNGFCINPHCVKRKKKRKEKKEEQREATLIALLVTPAAFGVLGAL